MRGEEGETKRGKRLGGGREIVSVKVAIKLTKQVVYVLIAVQLFALGWRQLRR